MISATMPNYYPYRLVLIMFIIIFSETKDELQLTVEKLRAQAGCSKNDDDDD